MKEITRLVFHEDEREELQYGCRIFPFSIGKKIYVAGSLPNWKYISEFFIEPAKKAGYTITHDWTRHEYRDDTKLHPRTLDEQRRLAAMDYHGVKNADTVIVVMNEPQSLWHAYRNTFCEIGIALGQKPVIIYNPNQDWGKIEGEYRPTPGLAMNVFYWHPSVTHVDSLLQFPWREFIPIST